MEFYFKDKQLSFSLFGESLFRIVSYSAYVFLGASAFMLSFSDIIRLRFLGFLLVLFLADRLLLVGKGERAVFELKGERTNIARTFTPRSLRLLGQAFRRTSAEGGNFHFHLMLELLKDKDIKHVLERLDVGYHEFLDKATTLASEAKMLHKPSELHGIVEKVAIHAYKNALFLDESYVEPRNLFAAIGEETDPDLIKLFYLFEIVPADLRQAVLFSRHKQLFSKLRRIPSVFGEFAHIPHRRRRRAMNRAWTARPTPLLNSMGRDLTELAERGMIGFLVGHEREFEALMRVVSRPGKPNAILVGEAGAGKSTVVEKLAYAMVKDEVPKALFDRRLIALEIPKLLSDVSEAELGGRIQQIVKEILGAENVVLFIPNVADLFKTHSEKGMAPIDFLLPIVKNEAIPVICESFPKDFKTFIEPRSDFLNQFEAVDVLELSEEEAIRFLIYQSVMLEKEFSLFVTFGAVRKSVELAHKYFRNRLLPGSAADLLKQASALARERNLKKLSADMVIEIAERLSKIPIQRAGSGEAEKLLNLESIIHKKLINQEEAVIGISRALREYRSGLARRGGPIASFLFVGPTGVGKTELAKILAEVQFGSRELMHRFDMSEYQDKRSTERLIGTSDGEKTGVLTDAVLQNPYSLVLLDEFEKAHGDVLNLFLQVFDDGRLTDSLGRTAGFENTIIIATSNAHSEFIKSEIEKGTSIASLSEKIKRKLTDYFKPELLNRFSQIVVFRNLTPQELEGVVHLAFKEIQDALEHSHGIVLVPDESAVKKIAELGWSPVFGARPLRTVLSEKIRSVLAEKILKKEIDRGNRISVSFSKNVFQFDVME